MARKCPFCGQGVLERKVIEETYTYKGRSLVIEQPGEFCGHCEEGVLGKEDMAATRKALHDFRASVDGLLVSEEVRRIRKKLKLNQKAAAEMFGGGPNAFSKYERGEVMQSKALDRLLRLLDRHPGMLGEIKAGSGAAA